MDPRQKFLAAILDQPDDDTARLVYADWLTETGRVEDADRAEFIRLQCRISELLAAVNRWAATPGHLPGGSAADGGPAGAALAEAHALQRRGQDLLRKWWGKWLPSALRLGDPPMLADYGLLTLNGPPGFPDYVTFDRGFVTGIGVEIPWRADEQADAVARFAAAVRGTFAAAPLAGFSVSFTGGVRLSLSAELGPWSPVLEPDRRAWRAGWDMSTYEALPHDATEPPMVHPKRARLCGGLAWWVRQALARPGAIATDEAADLADDDWRNPDPDGEENPPDPEDEDGWDADPYPPEVMEEYE